MVRANHIVWVAWQRHLRNETMADRLGADLHQLVSALPRVLRYAVLGARTVALLVRNRRARAVIAQNPSIVLGYVVVFLGRLLDMQVAIDAHNAALDPPGGSIMERLARRLVALTPLTIVTNEPLAEQVREMGGRAVVVPDPIPEWDPGVDVTPGLVTVISGWGADEPVAAVLAAARDLGELEVAITGRPDPRIDGLDIPANVRLTGHLPESEYIDLLARSAVVVDLTTRDNCIVCGATEAVALERPMVLSDTAVLRSRFGDVAHFTANEPAAIASAVRGALATADSTDVAALRRRLEVEWEEHRDALLHTLARSRRRRVRTWNLRREDP